MSPGRAESRMRNGGLPGYPRRAHSAGTASGAIRAAGTGDDLRRRPAGRRATVSGGTSDGADDAAEPEVARRGLDRLGLPRGRPIAEAVVGGAEVGSALDDLARDLATGLAPVQRTPSVRDPWVGDGAAAGVPDVLVVIAPVEVDRPFPHVAGHVVEAEAVGWEGAGGRRPLKPVDQQVLPRELALPRVGHH